MTNYDEKQIRDAIMDVLQERIAYSNDGMLSTIRAADSSISLLVKLKIKIAGNTVMRDGQTIYNIHRRYSAKKVRGCYRELKPALEAV
jgi:mRNA degradation ribonuclease J1/J2